MTKRRDSQIKRYTKVNIFQFDFISIYLGIDLRTNEKIIVKKVRKELYFLLHIYSHGTLVDCFEYCL